MQCLITLIFYFSILSISAQTLNQKIAGAYSRFEQDAQLQYGISSLSVLNALSGEVIFSKNGNTGLAPASTLKTVTSATAYHLLGQDFTWQTTIGYSGTISANGVLNGNLIIIGGGDPTLGSWRYDQTKNYLIFKQWTDAVKRAGITSIAGRIIADDRLLGTQTLPPGWIWQDMGNYYGAGPNSLTFNENQFDMLFKAGNRVGAPATLIRTDPDMNYLKIVNEVATGSVGSGDKVYAFSAPYSEVIYLRGTYGIDLNKRISASVPDPAYDVVVRLQDTLRRIGIAVQQPATTTRRLSLDKLPFTGPATVISVNNSPTLDQVIYWFNRKSVNLYGEHLIKTLARKQGKEISTREGAEVIKDFWSGKASINRDAMNIIDGSGLSPGNRITTLAMAKILQSVKTESWFVTYFDSFPVYNGMKMKSGSINDVLAYTGYETTASGVPVVFSFIVNNYGGSQSAIREKMFKVLDVVK